MTNASPIAVLGAGAWGTALALVLAQNKQLVHLWDRNPQHIAELQTQHCNTRYLPNVKLSDNIIFHSEIAKAVAHVDTVLFVVPSHAFRSVLTQCVPHLEKNAAIVWGTKGLDPQSSQLLHEVVVEMLGDKVAMGVLSGPNFAKEVAINLPTAVTLAANNATFAKKFQQQLHSTQLRVYTSDDLIGAQICGAVKNVLAIGVGVSDGLGLGANARCALITRGLAEMTRLGVALGGKPATFMGLAGVGDLVLTATDNQSRNRRFGLGLGGGKTTQQLKQELGELIEGADNAKTVHQLAKRLGVDMPIVEQVYQILYHSVPPADAVKTLLSRDPKTE